MPLGTGELLVIFLVLVLLVGASQVPKLARSLGRAQREFREGLQEFRSSGETETSGTGKEEQRRTSEPDEEGEGVASGL